MQIHYQTSIVADLTLEDRDNGSNHVWRWLVKRLVKRWRADQTTHQTIVESNKHESERSQSADCEHKSSTPEFGHLECRCSRGMWVC